jgi:quinoprotein relay system zinc metallohydrolase 2
MNKTSKIFLCILFLICGYGFPLYTYGGGEPEFNLVEIAPGNYLHRGIHAGLGGPEHDDIANIGFIVGDRCVAVIDTGGSVTTGRQLLGTVRVATDKPVCYVINTHIHYDHVLGNLVFVEDKPEFIGHAELRNAIEMNRGFFLEEFKKDLGESPTNDSIIGPTKTVADTLTIDLGNRTLLLTAYQKSHTYTDLTIQDELTGTLWTGDLLFRERIPVIDGSLKGWLAVMEIFKTLEVTMIIPGHGSPASNWQEALTAQEEYLTHLFNETKQAIANGQFMEEALDTVGQSEKGKWLLFGQQHRTNVSRAFVELEWD